MENRNMVFCIGFHKTGTRSLRKALKTLKFNVQSQVGIFDENISSNVNQIVDNIDLSYDAFIGNPWSVMYKRLDCKYPNSKFILTSRPTKNWINSVSKYFNTSTTPMREWIYSGYGSPVGNEDKYIARYEKHNKNVIEYFQNRGSDLLVLDITSGDGWDLLCEFLNKPSPDIQFPFLNKQS